MERKRGPVIESVHRALTLAKLLRSRGEIGVSEAAAALDVNASTAHRLLITLAADDFAVQRSDRRYVPGPVLAGLPDQPAVPLSARLRPFLEQLFEATGETVHVASLVGTRIQHLDAIEDVDHSLRFGGRVGVWLPAHITAGGKVLLADLTDAEVDARYATARAGGRVGTVDVDMDSLHDQLDDARSSRVAWNFGESEPGIAALAASTGFIDGQAVALSVALPLARYSKEDGDRWERTLLGIVDTIRRQVDAVP